MSSKPVVRCELHTSEEALLVGAAACLTPFNHPNHCVGHAIYESRPVFTSRIVAVDLEARRIETQNTIYQWEAA